jgi:SAM-dependent methyltransferase
MKDSMMQFICNVCNSLVENVPFEHLEREGGLCSHCGSTVRQRCLIHLLSCHLFGESSPIALWPERKSITGIGISDWHRFAEFFEGKVSYLNTQYDREPFLDVRKPQDNYRGSADFVICSDVLEHVPPPPQVAFDGLYSLLKPGGILVFTVPYGLEYTREHYPELHDWKLEKNANDITLVNTTKAGQVQTFRDLVFHGGWGEILEMRVFGEKDIARHVHDAGFAHFKIMRHDVPAFGIRIKEPWSCPMTATRLRRSWLTKLRAHFSLIGLRSHDEMHSNSNS